MSNTILDHNEYYFGIYPGQSQWKLWKVTAGNFGATPVASGSQTFSLNQYYTLSVKAAAGALTLYIDGSGPHFLDTFLYMLFIMTGNNISEGTTYQW